FGSDEHRFQDCIIPVEDIAYKSPNKIDTCFLSLDTCPYPLEKIAQLQQRTLGQTSLDLKAIRLILLLSGQFLILHQKNIVQVSRQVLCEPLQPFWQAHKRVISYTLLVLPLSCPGRYRARLDSSYGGLE